MRPRREDRMGSAPPRCAHREELRRRVEEAYRRRTSLRVVGGGRRSRPGDSSAIRAPAGLLDLWRSDLVARVGAGTSVAELEDRLEPLGLETGLVVPLPERATLGGIFASGEAGLLGGPNRSLRELALGALIVDGTGCPLECGARVVKNVAGYDTLRLHHGAGGAFGAISDIVLRLRARPELRSVHALAVPWPEMARFLTCWRQRSGADAAGELLLDAEAARRLGLGDDPLLCLVAEGPGPVVAAWAKGVGGEEITGALAPMRDLGFDSPRRESLILRVAGRTSKLLECWPMIHSDYAGRGRRLALVHDTRTRCSRIVGWGTFAGDDVERLVARVADELGPLSLDRGGAPGRAPATDAVERWTHRLRRSFDPAGIFPPPRRRIGDRS